MAYQSWCHRGEPQRTLFVGFENGYHGDTFGAMSVGRDPLFFGRFEPLLFRIVRRGVAASRPRQARFSSAAASSSPIRPPWSPRLS
jgi:adenosylmethionine-8-amino-7-oxononanoate aminotransferase